MTPALALAAAAAALPPICTDRPGKANNVCTVPSGHVQVEANGADWSVLREAGARTGLLTLGATAFKLGLSSRSDLQLGITPYARVSVENGGETVRNSGFGDMTVRYKQRLSADDAKVQFGLIPWVKIPTANRDIGNRKLEGGLAVPVSFALTGPVTMTLGPEADFLADVDGDGRHLAIVNLVNIGGPIAPRLTLAGELWSNVNFDPAGTIKQASADAALAYLLTETVQLDAGANLGLTSDTPDLELYAGASIRF